MWVLPGTPYDPELHSNEFDALPANRPFVRAFPDRAPFKEARSNPESPRPSFRHKPKHRLFVQAFQLSRKSEMLRLPRQPGN